MRTTHAKLLLATAAITLASASCTDPVTTASDEPLAAASTLASAHADVHRFAQGAGFIDLSSAGASAAEVLLDARVLPNGRITGTFRQSRMAGGLLIDFEGALTCLSVDAVNKRAWIAGVITRNNSTHPAVLTPIHEVGDDIWFRVVDYGEDDNATQADRSTVLGFTGSAGIITSAEYCATKPWPANDERTFPLGSGDIKVKQP